MNYTTYILIEEIELKEYRRREAVYLAQRIHKANGSPGFDWDKAIKGFCLKFKKETQRANAQVDKQYPYSPPEDIDWLAVIIHFARQPYSKGESHGKN